MLKNTRFSETLEIGFYRIAQELINNIIKHSEATEVEIQLSKTKRFLLLVIEDNGKGFQLKHSKHKGMGLSSIERRIEALGGVFEIDTSIGRGTTILIDIPTS